MDRVLNGHTLAPSARITRAQVITIVNSVPPMPMALNQYHTPSWGAGGGTSRSLTGPDIGMCFLAPIILVIGQTYDKLRCVVANASSSTHRFGLYYLSESTCLPTSIAIDAGTAVWTGAGAEKLVSMTFTPTQRFCALAWFFESRTDAVNPSIPTLTPNYPWPFGFVAPGTTAVPTWNLLQSTGNSAGALPGAGTFSFTATATQANLQPQIPIRRSV